MTLSVRLNNNLIGFWGFRVRHSVNLNNQLMIKKIDPSCSVIITIFG